ncbi:hypothetical protein [Siccirubricoccus sp. G192]|nr:hypothetical protein [Siccirubricoccus sp. G192]
MTLHAKQCDGRELKAWAKEIHLRVCEAIREADLRARLRPG